MVWSDNCCDRGKYSMLQEPRSVHLDIRMCGGRDELIKKEFLGKKKVWTKDREWEMRQRSE